MGGSNFNLKVLGYLLFLTVAIPIAIAARDVKSLNSMSISDAQLVISDSPDSEGATKLSVDFGKTLDKPVSVEDHQTVAFNFKIRNQAGKALSVHQSFLRVSNGRSEHIAIASANGKFLSAQFSVNEIRSTFLAEKGTYSLELIVGDSQIQNPAQWNIATLDIKFSNKTRYEAPVDPFAPRNEISHVFRPAESRPDPSVSFAFAAACLAPLLIFLIGAQQAGANSGNFPSGAASMYALAFQGCIGAILGLLALYWLRLNMMQTLPYLFVLALPTLFFGVKTLNALSAASTKTKKE